MSKLTGVTMEDLEWPVKTRELHNHHFDSTVWEEIEFRDDDIVIATYAKAGTTWMQQIIAQFQTSQSVYSFCTLYLCP